MPAFLRRFVFVFAGDAGRQIRAEIVTFRFQIRRENGERFVRYHAFFVFKIAFDQQCQPGNFPLHRFCSGKTFFALFALNPAGAAPLPDERVEFFHLGAFRFRLRVLHRRIFLRFFRLRLGGNAQSQTDESE